MANARKIKRQEGSPSTGLANGHSLNARRVSASHQESIPPPVDWEIPRKVLHSSIGFFTIYLYVTNWSAQTVVIVLYTVLAFLAALDFIRLRHPLFEKIYEACVGFLMRESEKKTVNGVIWYIVGCSTVLNLLPLDIAVVSILVLSWADTAASTFGRMYGRYTTNLPRRLPLLGLPLASRKSLAGFIAAAVTGALIAIGFWKWIAPLRDLDNLSWKWNRELASHRSVFGCREALNYTGSTLGTNICALSFRSGGWSGLMLLGAFTGIVAATAEALDLGTWDDNLTLPIITGGCLSIFLKLMRLFGIL